MKKQPNKKRTGKTAENENGKNSITIMLNIINHGHNANGKKAVIEYLARF